MPHMMRAPGNGACLTLLDCGLCRRCGHFSITRVTLADGRRTFACDDCLKKPGAIAAPGLPNLDATAPDRAAVSATRPIDVLRSGQRRSIAP